MDQNVVVISSIVSGIFLFIICILALTYYTSTTNSVVPNNQQSQDKITAINEAMRSALGPQWPFVLLFITILVAICLVFLYLASKKEVLTLQISDKTGHVLNISFIIFIIILTVLLVVLAIKEWQKANNISNIPNYTPSADQQKQNNQILVIVGLSLFVLLAGGASVWWFFFHKNTA